MKITQKIQDNNFAQNMAPGRYHEIESIPEGNKVQLHEIADINPSYRRIKKIETVTATKIIRLKSVDKKTGKILFPVDISKIDDKLRYRFWVKKGDILFPQIVLENTGPSLIQDDETYFVADYFSVLIPHKKVDPYYLTWALKHSYINKQIQRLTTGSYTSRINVKEFKNLKILWPNKERRKKLAQKTRKQLQKETLTEKGDSAVDKINYLFQEHFNINKKKLDRVKNQFYSYLEFEKMKEWNITSLQMPQLEKLIGNQKEVLNLGKIVEKIENGLAYRDIKNIEQDNLLKGKDIIPMHINKNNPGNKNNCSKKRILSQNDLLIRLKSKVGTTAVITKKEAGLYFYNDLARIKANEKIIKKDYLAAYLNSFIANRYIKAYMKNRTVKYLTINNLKKIPVIVPPIKEQEEIIETLDIKTKE